MSRSILIPENSTLVASLEPTVKPEAVVPVSPTGKFPAPLADNPTNPNRDEANRVARLKYFSQPKN